MQGSTTKAPRYECDLLCVCSDVWITGNPGLSLFQELGRCDGVGVLFCVEPEGRAAIVVVASATAILTYVAEEGEEERWLSLTNPRRHAALARGRDTE